MVWIVLYNCFKENGDPASLTRKLEILYCMLIRIHNSNFTHLTPKQSDLLKRTVNMVMGCFKTGIPPLPIYIHIAIAIWCEYVELSTTFYIWLFVAFGVFYFFFYPSSLLLSSKLHCAFLEIYRQNYYVTRSC